MIANDNSSGLPARVAALDIKAAEARWRWILIAGLAQSLTALEAKMVPMR